MTIKFNAAIRNDVLSGYEQLFANGQLRIYSSTQPLSVNDPVGGALLALSVLPADPFTTPINGVIEKNGVWVGEIIATGTAGWFRLFSNDFEHWIDGTITVPAAGGDMEIDSLAFEVGNVFIVSSVSITQPES